MDEPSGALEVVYADADPDVRAALSERFADDPDVALSTVARADDLADRLGDDRAVDCVVTGSSLADGDWRDVASLVRGRDAHLPLVLYADEPHARVATEVSAAGVDAYLPRPFDEDGALRERISTAAASYDRIRSLRSKAERYDAVMEALPFALYVKDEEARYVDGSSVFLEAVDDQEIVGKTDLDLWDEGAGETGRDSYRDDRRVVETGEPIVGKEERHEGGGDTQWMRTSKFPWIDDGEIRGLVGVTRNVTEPKLREQELRRKSQRLEQFASFVSHDLRNPINIAQGYLARARESGDEAALEEVAAALDRMDGLVDDLLAAVRHGDESAEWIDLRSFVERVWTGTRTGDATLEIEVPDDATLAAVAGQLRQLLDNLFRNAVEHGGSDVTVRVGLTDVGFYVEDDGEGVPPEVGEAVFEYGHSEDGTGIGLAIVSEIAVSHDWDVGLGESAEGGARFEFEGCLVRRKEFATVEEAGSIELSESTDVGGATPAGSYEHDPDRGSWTLAGGGRDVWSDIEEHFFVYGTVSGNARVEARIVDLEDVDEFSKAGLMVRDCTDTGAPLAHVGVTPGQGPEVIGRAFPEEPIETRQFPDEDGPPRWCRLDWIDNTVTLQTSTDGDVWRTLESRAIAGHDPVEVGLVACSHDDERRCEAVFEDVRAVRLEPGGTAD